MHDAYRHDPNRPSHRVVIVGHRGAAGYAPENTLAGIEAGIACGADFVEVDLRRTADGAVVALHDATVNRTTGGKGRIDRLSLQEAQRLDAGNGERIPTLEDVLNAADGRVGLLLELKVKDIAAQTVEAVRRARFRNPIIYASFLHQELRIVQTADPRAPLMALFDRGPGSSIAHVTQYAVSHIGLRHSLATRRLITALHRLGLSVFVFTPNRPCDIEHMLSLNVDGVISNFPDRIRLGQPPPPAFGD